MITRQLGYSDVASASKLIEEVSDQFSRRDFSTQGYLKFKEMVLNEGMIDNLEKGFLYWGTFEQDLLIGLIAVKPPMHLFNLFVDPSHHKKGVATRLWQHLLSQLKPKSMTVYSSTYAMDLYHKLGFEQSGEKVDNDELLCYPMLWKRPSN